ncbi:uncharacterized protein LOC120339680 isoform X2 [Styela clava]
MAESGTDYMCNKHGLLKMFVIIFGIISFSLVASSGFRGPLGWPFAAFLISWIISLTIYSTMTCVDDIGSLLRKDDFCCSLILFTFCMSATMLLSVYTCAKGPDCGERNAAIWFGFVTAGLYFVEIYMHKKNSPKPKSCNLQSDTTSWSGSRRVTADVFGFITSTAYLVQAVLLKRSNENVGD